MHSRSVNAINSVADFSLVSRHPYQSQPKIESGQAMEILDPTLRGSIPNTAVQRFATLALQCTQCSDWDRSNRPPMSYVVEELLQIRRELRTNG